MTEMKHIEALRPKTPPHINVGVSVSSHTMAGEAKLFRKECLDPCVGNDNFSDLDLDLMAGAFVTLAVSMPTSTYLLIDWIATCGHFDRDVIAEWAESCLGMEPIERPVRRPAKRGAR